MSTTVITRIWGTGLLLRSHPVTDPADARNLIVQPPGFITDAEDPVGSNETDWRRGWAHLPGATTTHA